MCRRPDCLPLTNTITQDMPGTTSVRMAVATVESVSRMPHLARIDVRPAKSAEPKANTIHIKKNRLFSLEVYIDCTALRKNGNRGENGAARSCIWRRNGV